LSFASELDGFAELLTDLSLLRHAVGLRQEQHGKSMSVHIFVNRVILARYVAPLADVVHQELHAHVDVLAVFALAWRMAAAHEGQPSEARCCDSSRISAVAKGAAIASRFDLAVFQKGEAFIDRSPGFGGNQFGR
jgi:hypothetical protein